MYPCPLSDVPHLRYLPPLTNMCKVAQTLALDQLGKGTAVTSFHLPYLPPLIKLAYLRAHTTCGSHAPSYTQANKTVEATLLQQSYPTALQSSLVGHLLSKSHMYNTTQVAACLYPHQTMQMLQGTLARARASEETLH